MSWSRGGVVLAMGLCAVCLTPAVVACGRQALAEPKPKFCGPESSRPGCASAQIGTEYELSLFTHCGVGHTYFDGRYWVIHPTQPYGGNYIIGVMQLVTKGLAQFRGGGHRFAFEPTRSSFAPPPCY